MAYTYDLVYKVKVRVRANSIDEACDQVDSQMYNQDKMDVEVYDLDLEAMEDTDDETCD